MLDIADVRRTNLRKLVGENEGMSNLARRLGLTRGSYISQLLKEPPIRDISEKTARKWEKALDLPPGWLDKTTHQTAGTEAGRVDVALLAKVIETLKRELHKGRVSLAPAQLAEFIAMQYADSVPTGRVNIERVRTLLRVLGASKESRASRSSG